VSRLEIGKKRNPSLKKRENQSFRHARSASNFTLYTSSS
jgi:hypothetical protein